MSSRWFRYETPVPDAADLDLGQVRRIHLTAVAGVGMAALAGMLRQRGYEVTGSDQNVYPPASTLLERLGIAVRQGFRAENLDPAPDLVIVGNVVSRGNPEVEAMLVRDLPYLSMPEALRRFFLPGKRPLVVSGTHGKTTSTALFAWMLHEAGRDPSVMVGGESLDFGGNFRLGAGEDFVLEGDEYDTAFFDKGPKFLHYEPQGLILTAIEFDHADIYRDLRHVTESFVKLIQLVPRDCPVAVCCDFPTVEKATYKGRRTVERFGLGAAADWRATAVRDEGGKTRFEVRFNARIEAELSIRLMGEMNVRNALGAYVLGRRLGLRTEDLAPGLDSFRGVRRRQELLHDGAMTVFDDFAHHPTAIAGTLEAVRRRYPGRRLWAVFEPRSNTSRRRIFQKEFAQALSAADAAVVASVFFKASDPIPEDQRLSVAELVEDLRGAGRQAATFADDAGILDHLHAECRPGDVIVFMSNGAFGGIPRRFVGTL